MSPTTSGRTAFSTQLRAVVAVAVAVPAHAARATGALVGMPGTDALRLSARLLIRSLPVVVVVAFFSGAMLTVQAASSLQTFGARGLSGMLVGFGGVREVFPLLACAALAARSGAEFASEIGALRGGRQLDALELMGLSPLRLVVAPRLFAAMVGAPICVLASCVSGLFGAHVIGVLQLGIDRGAMWSSLSAAIVGADFAAGFFKGVVLGWLVGVVATREGLQADGGAAGVGRAANRAVVRSMIAVCSVSLLLSFAIYGRVS